MIEKSQLKSLSRTAGLACLLFLGSFSLSPLSSQGADDLAWSGVWKLVQKAEKAPTVFYFHVRPDGKHSIYSHRWAPLKLEKASISGEQYELQFVVRNFTLSMNGQRRGFRLTGEWSLFHPQYRSEGDVTGHKIISSPNWEPLAAPLGLTQDGLLDLTSHLRKVSKTDKAFDSSWAEIKRDYHLILENPPATEDVKAALQDGDLAERAAWFKQSFDAGRRDAQKLMEEAATQKVIAVSLPFGPLMHQTFPAEYAFLSFNLRELDSADQARRLVAESFLRVGLRGRLPQAPWPHSELYRIGVPILLAQELSGKGSESRSLAMSAGKVEQISARVEELKSKIESLKEIRVADRTLGLTPEEFRVLSYRFAQFLKATPRSNKELYELSTEEMKAEYQKFIGS